MDRLNVSNIELHLNRSFEVELWMDRILKEYLEILRMLFPSHFRMVQGIT